MELAEAMRVASGRGRGDAALAWAAVSKEVTAQARVFMKGSSGADDLAHDALVGWIEKPAQLIEERGPRHERSARAFVRRSVLRRGVKANTRRRNREVRQQQWLEVHRPASREGRQEDILLVESFVSSSALLDTNDSAEQVLERLRDTLGEALRDIATRKDARRNALKSLHERHAVAFSSTTAGELVEAATARSSDEALRLARQSMNKRHWRMRAMLLTTERELQPALIGWLNTRRLTQASDVALVRRYLELVVT